MPLDPLGIIDAIAHPSLNLLVARLDLGGPYAAGDHLRSIWDRPPGDPLATSGIQSIQNTYGVMPILNGVIPPGWGYSRGWSSDAGLFDGQFYYNRMLQVVVQHDLGPPGIGHIPNYITTQLVDVHQLASTIFWDHALPSYIGLQIAPGLEFNLFYLVTP